MIQGCVIFDFDGVIADTECLHLHAYNHAFTQLATALGGPLAITRAQYFLRYIVYGNREGFVHMLQDAGRPHDDALLDRLCAAKDGHFQLGLHGVAEPLPGVRRVLSFLEERGIPRAICSGANRHEIDMLLEAFRLQGHFEIIVAIEDVPRGKPDPAGYNQAFAALSQRAGGLRKELSLAIEDSAGGCAAARAAGLRVLGVATSLALPEITKFADSALPDLSHLDLAELGRWLGI